MMPAIPAACSGCPIFALTEPSAQYCLRPGRLRREQRAHCRGGISRAIHLLRASIAVLSEHSAAYVEPSIPILGVDDEYSGWADEHMVDVRFRPTRPADVVESEIALGTERVEGMSGGQLADTSASELRGTLLVPFGLAPMFLGRAQTSRGFVAR